MAEILSKYGLPNNKINVIMMLYTTQSQWKDRQIGIPICSVSKQTFYDEMHQHAHLL